MRPTSAREATIPSPNKSPSASAWSSPGVRIATAKRSPAMRISSGSSTATSSWMVAGGASAGARDTRCSGRRVTALLCSATDGLAYGFELLDLDHRVVVGDESARVERSACDQHVGFGPMQLHVAARDVCGESTRLERSVLTRHTDAF